MQRIPWSFGLALGLALGFIVAARNSSGTYSLTSGNPVVAGTTITASNENAFRADVAAEITDSLSRSGKGGMTASLKLSNGTSSAPAWAFTSDTNTGMYRTGSDAIALVCGATTAQTWATTGAIFPLVATANAGLVVTNSAGVDGIVATGSGVGRAIVATGGGTSAAGISTTGGASNGRGIEATGDGTGMGVFATGGDSSGAGISATGGAPNGIGGVFAGSGTGAGGTFVGGTGNSVGIIATGDGSGNGATITGGDSSGDGALFTGGASNGRGVAAIGDGSGSGIEATGGDNTGTGGVFTGGTTNGVGLSGAGTGTGVGGTFACGTAASATVARNAVTLTNGYLSLSGVADPNSDVAHTDRVTPKNIVKAWGKVSSDGAGNCTVADGFNIASAAISGSACRVTVADDFSSADYAVITQSQAASAAFMGYVVSQAAGTIDLAMMSLADAPTQRNCSSGACAWYFIAVGAQ